MIISYHDTTTATMQSALNTMFTVTWTDIKQVIMTMQ